MRYLITGGTGLLGTQLINDWLEEGHEVINMSRSGRPSNRKGLTQMKWDGKAIPAEVRDIDVVVNMAGANVGQRWSDSYKKMIMDSRVNSTRACVEFIKNQEKAPRVFISASGINFYGDNFNEIKSEDDPGGDGFLSGVCQAWENEAWHAPIRTICLRISPVLSTEGGPLEKLITPYKMFVGGPTGTGDQGFSWIHLDDLVEATHFLIKHESAEGPFNLTAPEHVTNRQFSKALGNALSRPSFFRLPKGILELIFGEMSVILWGGTIASCDKLTQAGYQFKFPQLKAAFSDLLDN